MSGVQNQCDSAGVTVNGGNPVCIADDPVPAGTVCGATWAVVHDPPVSSSGTEVDCQRITVPAEVDAGTYLLLATGQFDGDVGGTEYVVRWYVGGTLVGMDDIKGDDGDELLSTHTVHELAPGDELAVTMEKTGGGGTSNCYGIRQTVTKYKSLI